MKRLTEEVASKDHLLPRTPATSIFAVKESHQALSRALPQQVSATRSIKNLHQGILIQNEKMFFPGSKDEAKTKKHNP